MKKLFLLVAVVAMVLSGCKKINEELDVLGARLDKLEQETIPTIDEQIAAINVSLDALDAMDKELKGYIDGLQATADNLQKQIDATNTKIGEVKVALQGEISAAKAEVLAELEALETELKKELAQINATIETLKAKDTELDNKIAELRSYIDTELGETTDWVNATFTTLEQYNSLVSEIATIKEQIKAINQSITNLETRLTTKINEDIATAVSTLNADIQQNVSEITTAYTTAIKSAKEEITAAYTSAIQNAINALDVSLKAWAGEQLANYYTIAEVEAKITALQTAITEGDATLQEELSKLKSQLETTATEITAAYKKAIEEAINTNNGVIDTKIANEIASVNQRITNEVATINAKIAEIESRLDNVEAKIAELLARIQSISYIPTYEDGKATVKYADGVSSVTLDFEISPKDAVAELAKVWQQAISVKAIYTQTRAVEFINMPIVKFEADTINGVISVTASGENLSESFFSGEQSASVRLAISDGNSYAISEYIPMIAKCDESVIFYTENAGNDLNMKMRYVEGGSFRMGATSEQGDNTLDDEKPIHTATLNSYYIAECEITQRQWYKIMGTTISEQRDKFSTSLSLWGVGDNYPMYFVSWFEAVAFCEKLSQLTGKTYALPTEAQWEYAARGGKHKEGTMYCGSNNISEVAWYSENSGSTTRPVKQKNANALGLYDMSGNVYEWCNDWYGDYSSKAQTNPMGPSSGSYRVLRGGSWFYLAESSRVSRRFKGSPSSFNHRIGFRVVCLL